MQNFNGRNIIFAKSNGQYGFIHWVPYGVEVERWLCNPRFNGSIPGAGNLEKLFIWMKIHGLTQKQTVTEL